MTAAPPWALHVVVSAGWQTWAMAGDPTAQRPVVNIAPHSGRKRGAIAPPPSILPARDDESSEATCTTRSVPFHTRW
jgi:hypothetical protein